MERCQEAVSEGYAGHEHLQQHPNPFFPLQLACAASPRWYRRHTPPPAAPTAAPKAC